MSDIVKREQKLRSANRIDDTTIDRIWKFYFESDTSIELTKKEEEIRTRLDYTWKLLGDILTDRQVLLKLMKQFDISERQGHTDIYQAKLLFGNPRKGVKEAQKVILSDILIKAMKKAYKSEDWKGLEKLALRYTRINGLDEKTDNNIADLIRQLVPTKIVISADPEVLKQEAAELVKDIDYEEIHEPEDPDPTQVP
jgi:hypothetical protein